jgi:hypothetical protein
MASFDLISDIHLDFWVPYETSLELQQGKIDRLIDQLLPANPSKVLVIAGDLGHHNEQNELLLKSLKRVYSGILFVFGNHDLYLVSRESLQKYSYNSMNRRAEMKRLAEEIEGVTCLDGDLITIDGVTYGGMGMWYDYSFGIRELGVERDYLLQVWRNQINDAKFIHSLPDFDQELAKLESIFETSNVIVTHVGPDWSKVTGFDSIKVTINSPLTSTDPEYPMLCHRLKSNLPKLNQIGLLPVSSSPSDPVGVQKKPPSKCEGGFTSSFP